MSRQNLRRNTSEKPNVCPTCNATYAAQIQFCFVDGTPLNQRAYARMSLRRVQAEGRTTYTPEFQQVSPARSSDHTGNRLFATPISSWRDRLVLTQSEAATKKAKAARQEQNTTSDDVLKKVYGTAYKPAYRYFKFWLSGRSDSEMELMAVPADDFCLKLMRADVEYAGRNTFNLMTADEAARTMVRLSVAADNAAKGIAHHTTVPADVVHPATKAERTTSRPKPKAATPVEATPSGHRAGTVYTDLDERGRKIWRVAGTTSYFYSEEKADRRAKELFT